VSVRSVAAEAGRSPGAIQKYFSSKDEMLGFALNLATERYDTRRARLDETGSLREILRAHLLLTLPLTPEDTPDTLIWTAFAGRAAHEPGLAATIRTTDDAARADIISLITAARHNGEASGHTDPAALADAVIAVADGLALRLLYTPDRAADMVQALDALLDQIFSQEPPRRR
jgi:AcrR family transcriptional regulator